MLKKYPRQKYVDYLRQIKGDTRYSPFFYQFPPKLYNGGLIDTVNKSSHKRYLRVSKYGFFGEFVKKAQSVYFAPRNFEIALFILLSQQGRREWR